MQPPILERRLAAILSADAVGYSRLMAYDQTATVRTISSYRNLIANSVEDHRGRVVDAPGDNVLAEFPTALDAARAAIEIQRLLHARNLGLVEDRRMRFRIGLHLGDITSEGSRIYGDGVNVASRIEALADPGGVCVSGAIQEQLRAQPDIDCKDLGERTLKNIPAPVRIFRVAFDGQVDDPKIPPGPRSARKTALGRRALLAGVMTVALAGGLAYLATRPTPAAVRRSASVSRWSIVLPVDARVALPGSGGRFDYSGLVAVSPAGNRIAYSVQDQSRQTQIYQRELDELEAQPIPGTVNARAPFFSPDGEWVGFLASNAIQKVALAGGTPQRVCAVDWVVSFDASWAPDGETIVYATDDGLWSVRAAGGDPIQLTEPDPARGEVGHHSPRVTADGRGVLFTVLVTPDTHLALLDLESRTWKIIIKNAAQGVVVEPDTLVFARSGELLTASYNSGTSQVEGTPVSSLQGIHTSPGLGGIVLTHFDVSETGTLVYVPGIATETVDRLLWVDHDGNETALASGGGTWVHPRLSPDGQRVSVDIHSSTGMRDVYIYEIPRGQIRQLTRTGVTWESEWRPDGERIAVMSGTPAGQWSLFWLASDFSGTADLLFHSSHAIPASWMPDGRTLLFHELVNGGIWRLSPGEDVEPERVLDTPARERFPSLSADGEWIAYVADDSGRREVFVQSFPDLGPKHRISSDGGGEPLWSPSGDQLFFRERGSMFGVDVDFEPTFHASRPRLLFTGEYDAAASGHQHYSISRDGKKFLMIEHGQPVGPSEVHVVLNWSQNLE